MVVPSKDYNRIVVKIGSSLLVDRKSGLKRDWLSSLADDIASLRRVGTEVLVVSSGAIALGRRLLELSSGALKLEESQAAAAVGQIELSRAYSEALGKHDLTAGQVLLTFGDTEQRRRYLNARETVSTLLKMGAIPIVNENDTVATSEIRYGDNDRLAARVATMIGADLLVLLSDVDGLYTAAPGTSLSAQFVEVVGRITPDIEAMAGDAGTELSRGGMVTKIEAGKIATAAGTAMVIASGKDIHALRHLFQKDGRATWFKPHENPVTARKKWISGQIDVSGSLSIDNGAYAALVNGKSLLPAGVKRVDGEFSRGDVIAVKSMDGTKVGCGLVAYDHEDAASIAGCKSAEIEKVLGYAGRSAMIHRDNLVLHGSHHLVEEHDA